MKMNVNSIIVRNLCSLCLLVILLILFACDSKPNEEVELAWQKSFREALIEGYVNFEGLFVNPDVAVYIFTYQIPYDVSNKKVFSLLKKQIKDYRVISESHDELVLRRSGTVQMMEVFDEYHFIIDEGRRKVTVMFASIDSPMELKVYPAHLDEFYKLHQRPSRGTIIENENN